MSSNRGAVWQRSLVECEAPSFASSGSQHLPLLGPGDRGPRWRFSKIQLIFLSCS